MNEYNGDAEFGNAEFNATPQDVFYNLLDHYSSGVEPLSNWTSEDLVKLIDAVDLELQNRAPPDSTYDAPPDSVNFNEDDEDMGYN